MSAEDIPQDTEIIHPGGKTGDLEQPDAISGSDGQLSYSQLALIASLQQSEGGYIAASARGHRKKSNAGRSKSEGIQPFLLPAWGEGSNAPARQLHERLQMSGVHTLSNRELITVVLSTDSGREDVVERTQTLLESYSLQELLQIEFGELCRQHGLDKGKAGQLQALLEIARRLTRPVMSEKFTIRSPLDAANLLIPEMAYLDHEELRVLVLNTKNGVVANLLLYQGTINSSVLRASEIFRPAITRKCPGIVICHNHPSGSVEPSPEDIQVTEQLVKAGQLLDIELIDHLIIGGKSFLSLKERLMWK